MSNPSSDETGSATPTTAITESVRRAVSAVTDPELHRPLGELNMIRSVEVSGQTAQVGISLTIAGCPAAKRIESDVYQAALSVPGISVAEVSVGVMTPQERADLTVQLRGGKPARTIPYGKDSLTRVILVTSGKGGVGKSTVTANLAAALAESGLRTGIIDADVHGFSIPGLLGISPAAKPTRIDDMILPPEGHGVAAISIGMFLREGEQAVAWRGPMLHRAINQFLTDVYFGALDILLIDMPPGTGDVAISVGQLLPNAEVLVVTTPQEAAADVAIRSGVVAKQTGQRLVGVIENMAAMRLPDGSVMELFGSGGGQQVADALSTAEHPVPLLGSIPLSPQLRLGGDAGVPAVLGAPTDPAAAEITRIATSLAAQGRKLPARALPIRPV